MAKKFQEEACEVQNDEIRDDIILSPVSKCSRSKRAEETHPYTTSKTNPTGMLVDGVELDDDMEMTPEESLTGSSFESVGSWENRSWGPEELWNIMYPKAPDEQIVTAVLINFLKGITSNFSYLSND